MIWELVGLASFNCILYLVSGRPLERERESCAVSRQCWTKAQQKTWSRYSFFWCSVSCPSLYFGALHWVLVSPAGPHGGSGRARAQEDCLRSSRLEADDAGSGVSARQTSQCYVRTWSTWRRRSWPSWAWGRLRSTGGRLPVKRSLWEAARLLLSAAGLIN